MMPYASADTLYPTFSYGTPQAMTKVIATNANIAVRNLLQAVGGYGSEAGGHGAVPGTLCGVKASTLPRGSTRTTPEARTDMSASSLTLFARRHALATQPNHPSTPPIHAAFLRHHIMPPGTAGGIVYLYLLSPSLCGMTVAISAVLWAVTIVYGDFARRMQKVREVGWREGGAGAREELRRW